MDSVLSGDRVPIDTDLWIGGHHHADSFRREHVRLRAADQQRRTGDPSKDLPHVDTKLRFLAGFQHALELVAEEKSTLTPILLLSILTRRSEG